VISSSTRWLGLLLLGWTCGSAALGEPIQPRYDLRDKSPQNTLERFEADYKKALADPAYDVVQLHNDLAGYLYAVIVSGRKLDFAIEISEAMLARDKVRGDYGGMGSSHTIGQLVRLYHAAGKNDRAVTVLDEFVNWARDEYGEKNLFTLDATRHLAESLGKAKQYDRAIKLYQSLVACCQDTDPGKARSLGELMTLYKEAGKSDLERATGEALLELTEKVHGKGASSKATGIRVRLAELYSGAGNKDLALKMLEGDLEESRKTNGADHTKTLDLLVDVAGRYFTMRRPEKALAFLTELVELRTKKQGADHVDTLLAMNYLAQAYEGSGKLDKAIEVYAAVIPNMKIKLGAENYQTLAATLALATAYENNKQSAKAEPWWRDYLEGQRKLYRSAESSPALQAQALLGWNLLKQEKWTEAEKTLGECLAGRRKNEPQSWSTFNSASQLGGALLGQKKYQEAEPLLVEGYEGMKKREANMPVQARPRLTEALERLVQLYDAMNRKDKADELRKQLPQKQP
jgi:eukaryotic-like serine/threonine-protein kinase